MIVDELISVLCKCQVIPDGTSLYKAIADCDELDYVEEALNSAGYNLAYNKKEDCFVVY